MKNKNKKQKNKNKNPIETLQNKLSKQTTADLLRAYSDSETDKSQKNKTDVCVEEYSFDSDFKLSPDFPYEVSQRLLKTKNLLAIDKTIFQYLPEDGYFSKLVRSSRDIFIDGFLTNREYRLIKDSHYTAIANRICRGKDIQVSFDDFNANANMINCENGIVELAEDKIRLEKHDRKYRFTYQIRAKYLKKPGKAPYFEEFCKTSLGGDKTNRKLLLQIIGYTCSDFTRAKKMFFLIGEANSGKSLICHFIEELIGPDFISNIPLHKLNGQFSLIELFGMKANIQAELDNKAFPDLTMMKSASGGDRITAAVKHKGSISFTPKTKFIVAGNALPFSEEKDAANAFLDRICLLLFGKSIPKEKRDLQLAEKLWEERDIIFSLAMDELLKLKNNNFKFEEPQDSKEFLEFYKTASNSLDDFIDTCCTLVPDSAVSTKEFVVRYNKYCKENALKAFQDRDLYRQLYETHKINKKRKHTATSNLNCFVGIEFK